MTFSIFHISDLHFKNDHPCIDRIRLLRDDILNHVQQKKKSYLVFTGDLVDSADDNLYSVLLDEFFLELHAICKGIYLVPGNHDVQWSVSDEVQCDRFLNDTTQSYLYDSSAKLCLDNPFLIEDPFSNYRSLQSLLSSYQEETFFGSLDINSDFSFVGLNSAWLSCRRSGEKKDIHNLKIDPSIVQYFSEKIDTNKLCICTMHHPLTWMVENGRQRIQDLISSHFDLFMFGHVHSPTTTAGNFNGSSCLFLQAPAVHSTHTVGCNAYAIVNVDGPYKKYEITYRTFSDSQHLFVPGVDICPEGVRYPTEEDRNHWYHLRHYTKSGLHARFEEDIKKVDFSDWFKKHFIAKSKMNKAFIEPNVARHEYVNGRKVDAVPMKLSESLDNDTQYQFVMGPQDCGLTTAAFLTCRHISEHFTVFRTVPAYINLANLNVNKASLLREANRTTPVHYTYAEITKLADEGGITFVCDQIGLPDTTKFNHLLDVLKKYFPTCRAILFCAEDSGVPATTDPGELQFSPLRDVVFAVQELTVDGIQELIRVRQPQTAQLDIDSLLNKVVASFKQMDEPVFPSAATVLLDTLQQMPDFRPINRVRLLERYVECLLGRLDPEDVREGSFNSNDKIIFLSHVAGVFATESKSKVSMQQWDRICKQYSENKLLELPGSLLEEFTQKGVLLIQNGSITFRADYLFSYFVAKEMNLNPSIFTSISSQDAFYANHKEIVFYGELEGVDSTTILNDTRSRLISLEEDINEMYVNNEVNFEEEWQTMLSEGRESSEKKLLATVNDVMEEEPTEASVNRARARDLHSVDRRRGVVERATIRELEARWLVSIKTYFQLLKHAANLPAKDKMQHLWKAVQSSELFVKSLATKRTHISTKVLYYDSGILYINPLAEIDIERSKQEIKYLLPMSFASMLGELLANPQLAPAYRELLKHHEGSEITRYLARQLLLEIPSNKNKKVFVDDLINAKEIVLQTCSLQGLKEKYLGYSLSEESRVYYSDIIASIAKEPKLEVSFQYKDLQKRRLLSDMKKNFWEKK